MSRKYVCPSCGNKTTWKLDRCANCGHDEKKARVVVEGSIKLVLCEQHGCGFYFGNPEGVCPRCGTTYEDKTPTDWPPKK